MIDTSFGPELAAMMTRDLNKISFPAFIESIWGYGHTMRNNFTLLCLNWFTALIHAKYDRRNLYSIRAAIIICQLTYDESPKYDFSYCNAPSSMTAKYNHGDKVSGMLTELAENRAFIDTMILAKPKIQKNFTRLCLHWLTHVKNKNEPNRHYTLIAKKALSEDNLMPFQLSSKFLSLAKKLTNDK